MCDTPIDHQKLKCNLIKRDSDPIIISEDEVTHDTNSQLATVSVTKDSSRTVSPLSMTIELEENHKLGTLMQALDSIDAP